MLRFLVHRAVQSLVVLVLMSVAVYALIGLMPGDPIDLMIGANPNLTAEDAQRLRAIYGLDRPLLARYAAWAMDALQGDLGYSRNFSRPVLEVVGPRLANTAALMIAAFVIALAVGISLGIVAAAKPRSVVDHIVNLFSFVAVSVPTFWLALVLILIFSVKLGWLPASGTITPGQGDLLAAAKFLILPVATLAFVECGGYARYTRAAMLEAMSQDWIRTARAKGASRARVLVHHALRNALIPVATIAALGFGTLFSGALVTETMFAYPGMGKLIFDAVMGNDYNLALVGLLFATLLTLLGNLAADLAYVALDPRISYADRERDR
jgi:peptide/nickel transport system permease protein